jgi:hypothetical protein
VVDVGDNSDIANTWVQIENSSKLRAGCCRYYYFTMAAKFPAFEAAEFNEMALIILLWVELRVTDHCFLGP